MYLFREWQFSVELNVNKNVRLLDDIFMEEKKQEFCSFCFRKIISTDLIKREGRALMIYARTGRESKSKRAAGIEKERARARRRRRAKRKETERERARETGA